MSAPLRTKCMERDHICASAAAPVRPPTGGEESSTSKRAETTYAYNVSTPSVTHWSKHVNRSSNQRAGRTEAVNDGAFETPNQTANGVFWARSTCRSVA